MTNDIIYYKDKIYSVAFHVIGPHGACYAADVNVFEKNGDRSRIFFDGSFFSKCPCFRLHRFSSSVYSDPLTSVGAHTLWARLW
jgi:hypothetical protein